MGEGLTGCVVLVGVVLSIGGTGPKDAPKRPADHPLAETQQVDMVREGAVFKGFGEVGVIDVVLVGGPEKNRKVVVPVCEGSLA